MERVVKDRVIEISMEVVLKELIRCLKTAPYYSEIAGSLQKIFLDRIIEVSLANFWS